MSLVLFLHVFSCIFLTGLIWTIQLVHYPSFHWIADNRFEAFARFHAQRITYIVGPMMLLELGTALGLIYLLPHQRLFTIGNGLLVIGIWMSTLGFSIPCHSKLQKSRDPKTIDRLIITNWPRTILWTVRTALLSLFFMDQLGGQI
ncbi:hypothetical protein SAMN06296036_104274 [Pseudobacteriovorax antillogorgiicola]|uniref:DUF1772 domain-containing protein n=1 Tax=Pseudobacteriovorax antillogorgiicola TaxID=1513793 RepID=A0A1Y6BKM2_9BACT|nr:hypothetical protein EDD56_10459 [Pseudobacteriovorax antillogorgiicola]SMF08172.1 hypothetical protein SAMN06296036_104274 [Pseudobacteriovorax antillogorgiicola]